MNPNTFRSQPARKAASSIAKRLPPGMAPALLTRMSIAPAAFGDPLDLRLSRQVGRDDLDAHRGRGADAGGRVRERRRVTGHEDQIAPLFGEDGGARASYAL